MKASPSPSKKEVKLNKSEAIAIDIILPVHGRLDLTKQAVDAIYAHTKAPFHLIVMDDSEASIRDGAFHAVDPTDTTSVYFQKLCKLRNNITHYNSPTPFKTGNEFFNKGFELCRHDYVATIMNSTRVEPEWDVAAIEIMQKDPKVGVIGFKNLFPHGVIESAGIKFVGHVPTDFGRDQPAQRLNAIMEADAVQWAFALLRLKAVKGVIEDIYEGFVGWDDIANCFEVKKRGWKILYCGLGAGYHTPRATRGDDRPEAQKMNTKNAEIFWKKYGFWDMAQESKRSLNKMDVSNKLSAQTKANLGGKVLEFQVLTNLAANHKVQLQDMGKKALEEVGMSSDLYDMEVDPQNGVYNVREKPGAITPKVEPKIEVPPAGDTKCEEPVTAGGEVKV